MFVSLENHLAKDVKCAGFFLLTQNIFDISESVTVLFILKNNLSLKAERVNVTSGGLGLCISFLFGRIIVIWGQA